MEVKGFLALPNFRITCGHFELPVASALSQIQAVLVYLNFKYYAAQYSSRMWGTIRVLGNYICSHLTDQQEADFKLVHLQAKEIFEDAQRNKGEKSSCIQATVNGLVHGS